MPTNDRAKPPAPFRTFLGWSLGSEEAADKERLRIRKRQALDARDWNAYFGRQDERDMRPMRQIQPEMSTSQDERHGDAQDPLPAVPQRTAAPLPARAVKLHAWLIGHGFRVRILEGRLLVGPPEKLSNTVRGWISQEREGLRRILQEKQ